MICNKQEQGKRDKRGMFTLKARLPGDTGGEKERERYR